MGWEREYHHLDLVEEHHVIGLINRDAKDSHGAPKRYSIQILIGDEKFEHRLGKSSLQIKLGGALTVQPDGTLKDDEGNVIDPKAIEREMIARLDAHHAKMLAYARKHGVPLMGNKR